MNRIISLKFLLGWVVISLSAASFADSEERSVSLFTLIGNAEHYVDKKIRTAGFLIKKGNIHLFVTEDHAVIYDYQSSIAVSDADDGSIYDSQCFDRYVFLSGTVVETIDTDEYALVDIEYIYDPKVRSPCWTMLE